MSAELAPSSVLRAVWLSHKSGNIWLEFGDVRHGDRLPARTREQADTIAESCGWRIRWDLPSVKSGCTSYPVENAK